MPILGTISFCTSEFLEIFVLDLFQKAVYGFIKQPSRREDDVQVAFPGKAAQYGLVLFLHGLVALFYHLFPFFR